MEKVKNKVGLLLLGFLIGFFSFGGFLFAQRIPELTYPTIPGVSPPQTINVPIPPYLKYVYNFAIILAGFLCFILFVWGGIRYLSSGGSPRLMKIARDQVIKAGVGLIIIFSSYLILNTINPQLVLFPSLSIQKIPDIPLPPSPSPPTQKVMMEELPMGALITSEIGVSSFIRFPTTTDPAYDASEYDQTFEEVFSYSTLFQQEEKRPTEYQGALHGRRLKRIHEVATTTLPATHMLADLSKQLVEIAEELKDFDEKLYQATKECNCSNCNCPSCGFGLPGPCPGPECDPCRGNPCSPATIQKIQDLREKIPKFYENENDPIPCKVAEIKYLAEHFRRFLESNINRPLVKNDDYEDESYYWSDEAKELRNKIKECINASYGWESWITSAQKGDDLRDEFEKIEEIIWNSSSSLAFVENKGTVSPITDPPQRDVKTNINQLEEILSHLRYIKHVLNPHYFPSSVYPTLTHSQFYRVKAELQMEEFPWEILPFNLEPDLRSPNDPATFFRSPSSGLLPRSIPKNIVFAQEKEKETSAPEKEVEVPCRLIAEIPVGKTMDEAIKLIEDILRELKNIYNKGGFMVEKALEQIKEAKKLGQSSQELVDATDPSNIVPCELVRCKTICHQITIPTPLGDIILHNCIGCFFERVNGYWYTEDQINKAYFDIKTEFSKINSLYQSILDAKESLYESFYKLNSVYPEKDPQHPDGHPKAGERVPIGKDLCCKDDDANCREEGELVKDKLEERDYTLVEKLIEIQKLLNRTRDFKMFSYYIKELSKTFEEFAHLGVADWLVRMNFDRHLVDLQEIENVKTTQKVGPLIVGGKYSLTDCQLLYKEAQQYYTQAGGTYMLLEDWREAKERAHISYEMCPPDPPLECSYFDSRIFKKRVPLNCYSYDENWFIDYDLASDFYCCVKKE